MSHRPYIKDDSSGTISDLAIDAETLQGYKPCVNIVTLEDNGSTTAGTWLAKTNKVSALVDGQLFLYKITVAGASTTTLNITGSAGTALGAKTVYRVGTTKLTTQYPIGHYILLAYNSLNTCFRVVNDYDANSDTYVRQYQHGKNAAGATNLYPILTRYNLTNKSGTYDNAYARFYTDTYIDVTTGYLYAPKVYSGGSEVVTKVNDTSPNTNGNVSINFLKSGDYKASIPYLTNNATIALTSDIPVTKYTQSTVNLYTLADGRYINSTENDITMYYHPLHICNKKWKPGDILYIKFHRFYLLTQGSDSLCIVFGAANDTEDFAWCNSAMELDTIPQVHESMKEFGSESTPVYLSRDTNYGPFRFKKCKLYGGGTGIEDWNGYDALGKTVNAIYAPETAGTSGQFLKSNGSGAPIWETVTIPSKTSDLTNDSGYTTNTGTVTSVRVQAGTGLSSSTSTASTTTLDTTISIASGYKLLTNSEYNTLNAKQDKISVGTNGQLLSSNGSSLVWTNDNRGLLHHDLNVEIANTTTDSGWSMFNSTYTGYLLKSVRFNANSPAWGVGDYGSGIVFGGADTKGVISLSWRLAQIKFAGGNSGNGGPLWWIGLTGTSAKSYDLDEIATKQKKKVTGSWTVSTTNRGPMVDIILAHPDIKIYYKTYTSATRTTDIASVLFNASYSDRQDIYTLSLRYLDASGSLATIGSGTIYYEYFE